MPASKPDIVAAYQPLHGRTVALCVTGSIAAYKAVEVARLLVRAGAKVLPVMTESATRFVGKVSFSGICGESVASDMWDAMFAGELHVSMSERAELVALVPATADVLARLAQGRADDLVTALALCARCPVLAAPAMHPRMWDHPATQRNVALLAADERVTLIGPVHGEVASGDVGAGRMAEPAAILAAIVSALSPRDLVGLRIVVTAGPTIEDLDPVRFLGNRSTGKMGFAIAERAASRGAEVTLVAGPVALPTPHGVKRVDVRGAVAMRGALWQATGVDLARTDALIMAAAVADYRPSEVSASKIKKQGEQATIELVKNPDLLAEIGAARAGKRPVLVGFAVETDHGAGLVAYAKGKLVAKKVDFIVANDAAVAFGGDESRVTLVGEGAPETTPPMSKHALADLILDRVRAKLGP